MPPPIFGLFIGLAVVLGLPALLIVWILSDLGPLSRKLWLNRNGRALEELLLSAGTFAAPGLMLLFLRGAGGGYPDYGTCLTAGVPLGLLLWGMMKLFLRLFRELITLLTCICRWPRAGGDEWVRPLATAIYYAMLLFIAFICLMGMVAFIVVISDPNPR